MNSIRLAQKDIDSIIQTFRECFEDGDHFYKVARQEGIALV